MSCSPLVLLLSLHADPFSPSGVGEGGGTHAYLRELMREFALANRHCILITRRANRKSEREEYLGRTIRLFRIDTGPPGPLDKRRLNEFHHESLSRSIRIVNGLPSQPNVIHSVYWNSGRLAFDLSKELQIPYVHTVISNGVRRRLEGAYDQPPERESIEQKVFSGAWAIFSISSEERDDLMEHYGIDGAKIRVVGRPVADSFLNPAHDECGLPRPLRLQLA